MVTPQRALAHPAHRLSVVSLLALACVVAVAGPVRAHTVLSETSPDFDEVVDGQAERVVETFTEPVEVNFGAVRVPSCREGVLSIEDCAWCSA